MQLGITVTGMDRLQAIAEAFPETAERHLNDAIERSLERLRIGFNREAPVGVTGNLRDKWDILMGRFTGSITSGVPYALDVEEGQQPGTMPDYSPGSDLAQWADMKGIPAYLVARKIERVGTTANPFAERAIEDEQSGIDDEFATALDDIIAEL